MRTIKFRGKCAKDSRYSGEWVYGACVQCEKSNDVLIIYAINDRNSCSYHVEPDTVGQFTGLYDKNGEEIYEGDILQYRKSIFSVSYEYSHLGSFSLVQEGFFAGRFGDLTEPFYCEVIGNVFDNLDLLK